MKFYTTISTILLVALFLFSCEDGWDNHYGKSDATSNTNLYELIKQDASLTKFSKLIEKSGYDELLSSSQTYTVWAPTDENIIVDVNTIDSVEARLLVGNQIARFNNPTSAPKNKSIRMINKKIYFYSEDASTFGGKSLINKNTAANNGLLHTTSGMINYSHNLYEYLMAGENTSMIADFISLFQENKFDISSSVMIENKDGSLSYDSIMIPYNRLLEHPYYGLGAVNNEDSIYTMLLPNNQAWTAAYSKIAPCFKVYSKNQHYADSVTYIQTSLAIMNNLIFRGRLAKPSTLDSIVPTYRNFKFYNWEERPVIYNVSEFFGGSQRVDLSNGFVFMTNNLALDKIWTKPINIEGEYTYGRTTSANTSVSTRAVTGNSLLQKVSGNRYIFVEPTNTTSQAAVIFEIPDVLSCKYNVYVDLLPSIDNNNIFYNDSTKLSFSLSYMDATGTQKTTTLSSPDFVTSGTQKVRMLVLSKFEFPVSNFYDQLWHMDPRNKVEDMKTTTLLTIRTNVTNKEINDNVYKRRFSVDKIIFEPVLN